MIPSPRRGAKSPKPLASATPAMAQYLAIKRDNADCLVFFRMGDFYELFFEDAETAAQALDITLTKRGKHKGQDVPMCGVPAHAAESYIARLIRQGFRIAVAEQEAEVTTTGKGKPLISRKVKRVITQGTLTEETLLDARKDNFLAALASANAELALAWLDLSTGLFRTQLIQGDEQSRATSLAALLSRVDPCEILIGQTLLADTQVATPLKDWQAALRPLPLDPGESHNSEKRLCQAYGVQELTAFGPFSRAEICAAGCVLDYVELTQCQAVSNLQPLQRETSTTLMDIDPATARNLELVYASTGERAGSLLADIDHTLTGAGARLLHRRIAAPSTEPHLIEARLAAVEMFLNDTQMQSNVRGSLKTMPDIERALSRLVMERGNPRDLGAIRDGLKLAQDICDAGKDKAAPPVTDWLDALTGFADLQAQLEQALATQLPVKINEGGFIAPGYNPTLDEKRRLRDHSRQLIAELQTRYVNESGIASLKIKHNNILGYFIEIKASQVGKLGGTMGFRHRQTMSESARFSSDELVALDLAIRQAADEALALEAELFTSLASAIISRVGDMRRLAHAMACLDVATATAQLSLTRNFCRPEITQDAVLTIEGGRHPMVESALHNREGDTFRDNDCTLSAQDRLWLLTGPNMAGKSTFLRQAALIVVLAQAGLYVPATRAVIGIVDRLFSRVGAADDLARGRSTFMVEMVETATILHQATDKSFVILDEIGRGTATFDGLSIAWAVVEHLHNVNGCRALFATHYQELTALSGELSALSLHRMAVKEWKGDIAFIYAVEAGAAKGSYGVHVAQLAGLPDHAVKRARHILATLEQGERNGTRLGTALPLFQGASGTSEQETQETQQDDTIADTLKQAIMEIEPDTLTPRQALDCLYRLKTLSNGPEPGKRDDPQKSP